MSAALVKLQRKGQMVIPRSLREEAGVVEGILMKVAVVNGGRFLVTPQVSIDRAIVANPRKTRKQVLRELAATVAELRREAKAKGLDKLSMREIDATVAAARRAHETAKQRAK
jgi:bifunctional DNA-binding transcriptional regulator/antitoxin component of YhaV-PrlF toxin-antitoxin module